jgi:hypothetical protein
MSEKLILSWGVEDYISMLNEIIKIPSINQLLKLQESIYSTQGYHLIDTTKIDDIQYLNEKQDQFFKNRKAKNPSLKPKQNPNGDKYQIFNLINTSDRPVSIH